MTNDWGNFHGDKYGSKRRGQKYEKCQTILLHNERGTSLMVKISHCLICSFFLQGLKSLTTLGLKKNVDVDASDRLRFFLMYGGKNSRFWLQCFLVQFG